MMQQYYTELYKEVGTNGRLITEAALKVLAPRAKGGTLFLKINNALTTGQIANETASSLHLLRTTSNKGCHYDTLPFEVNHFLQTAQIRAHRTLYYLLAIILTYVSLIG